MNFDIPNEQEKTKRIKILGKEELSAIYDVPQFSEDEQKHFFLFAWAAVSTTHGEKYYRQNLELSQPVRVDDVTQTSSLIKEAQKYI